MKQTGGVFLAAILVSSCLLLFGLVTVRAAAPGAGVDSGSVPVFTHGVASGDVTATSAVLWTRIDRETNVKVEVWDNPGLQGMKAFQQTVPQVSAARDFTIKVDATGLSPDTDYYYRFKHDDTDGASFSDLGTFRTAPSPYVAADVRFTWTGDADGTRDASGVPFRNNFEVLHAARLEGGAFCSTATRSTRIHRSEPGGRRRRSPNTM